MKRFFKAATMALSTTMLYAADAPQIDLVTSADKSPFSMETIIDFQKREVYKRRPDISVQENKEFLIQLVYQQDGLAKGDRTLCVLSEAGTLTGAAWFIPMLDAGIVHIANGTCEKNSDYLYVLTSAVKAYPESKIVETTVHNSRALLNGLLQKGQWSAVPTPKDATHSDAENYTTWQMPVEGMDAFVDVAKQAFAALQTTPIH